MSVGFFASVGSFASGIFECFELFAHSARVDRQMRRLSCSCVPDIDLSSVESCCFFFFSRGDILSTAKVSECLSRDSLSVHFPDNDAPPDFFRNVPYEESRTRLRSVEK